MLDKPDARIVRSGGKGLVTEREAMSQKVVCIDSKHKDAGEVEACLRLMYANGELNDEQISLIEKRFPGFRLPKRCEKTPLNRTVPFRAARRV